MEKLNEYLQTLLSTCSYELHLEPNKQPFVVAANGATDIANTPLLGTQISTMIFPLIPAGVRQELPSRPEVEFTHTHNLGDFSFLVKKSPSGFNVTIRPVLSASDTSPQNFLSPPEAAAATSPIFNQTVNETAIFPPAPPSYPASKQEATPPLAGNEAFSLESSSANREQNSDSAPPVVFSPEIVFEEAPTSFETEALFETGAPPLEIVSVNDPEFITTFSETSDYEPPGRRDDYYPQTESYDPPQNNFTQQQTSVSQPPAFQPEPAFEQSQFLPAQPPMQFAQPQPQFAAAGSAILRAAGSIRRRFRRRCRQPAGKSADGRDVPSDGGNRRVGFASVGQHAADDSQRRQNAGAASRSSRASTPAIDARAFDLDYAREKSGRIRPPQRYRFCLRNSGFGTFSRQYFHGQKRNGRRFPHHSDEDFDRRAARAFAGDYGSVRTCRKVWSSSPVRPARENRRRSAR